MYIYRLVGCEIGSCLLSREAVLLIEFYRHKPMYAIICFTICYVCKFF